MVYSPYPQFTNRSFPTGHNVFMTPYQYGYPPVLMPPQQGIATQPHATMASPFMPFGGIINITIIMQVYMFVLATCICMHNNNISYPLCVQVWVSSRNQ